MRSLCRAIVTIKRTFPDPAATLSVAIVFFGVLILSGCNAVSGLQNRESLTQLERVTNTYRKLMRWGHFDQAAQYLKARGEETIEQPDLEDMARYKISNYTVADQLVADTRVDARVTAYVEFYNIDTGVISSVRDEQFWWYDKEAKRWFLGTPMVNFADYEK